MDRGKKRERRDLAKDVGIRVFADCHKGSKCFIVGAGPSLKDLDLSCLNEYPCICVNSSILAMPWDKDGDIQKRFWMSCDVLCAEWDYFWKKVIRTECTRIVRNSWTRQESQFKGISFRYYKPRRDRDTPFSEEPDALMGTSSIISAVDFALLLGCKDIYLVGVDHKMKDGRSHFWQFWPDKDRPVRKNKPSNFKPNHRQQEKVFQSNIRSLEILKSQAKHVGSKIYNCSKISSIKMFEFKSLQDALDAKFRGV